MLDKQYLRKEFLAKRKALGEVAGMDAAHEFTKNLLSILPDTACTIALYSATRGEMNLEIAAGELAAVGHKLCLPVIEHKEGPLVFISWKPGDELVKGSYAIDIPKSQEKVTPDIIIVPLIAFDASGNRLGYGAGYYDQTIANLRGRKKDLLAIGAAYAMQQAIEIPAEAHDERLDMVVTEKGIIRIKNEPE